MSLFNPSRPLLFPQFETYRLRPLDPASDLASYPLPADATQSRVGYNSAQLSFKEVRGRVGWDHLAVHGARGIYVDKDWGVVGFQLDSAFTPTFTKLAELPIPISSTEQQAEFPSALPLSSTQWAIATGSGSLYVLQTTPPSGPLSGGLIARYDLPISAEDQGCSPFLLRAAHFVSEREVKILATRSVRSKEGKSNITTAQLTKFDLLEFTLDPTKLNQLDEGEPARLSVNWTLQGGDLPIWANWNAPTEEWLVLSAEQFRVRSQEQEKEETEDERERREREAKVARLGLGASLLPSSEGDTAGKGKGKEKEEKMDVDVVHDLVPNDKAYPYNWTQNAESINLNIPLPAGVSRADLQVSLTSTTLTLAVSTSIALSPELSAFLSKPTRSWWTAIDVSSSTWTFDASKSILEFDLAKADENTRWPSVFTPTTEYVESDDEDEGFDEVPETLSASTLAAVRETFSQIKTRGPDEPEGIHPAMPALLREEMDFDLDDEDDFGEGHEGVYAELGGGTGKVGREVFVGSIKDGVPKWSKTTTSVLSTPLSGSSTSGSEVIIKSAVDGLLFQPTSSGVQQPWDHVSTNPALAFVISSKKDLRLVRHLTSTGSASDDNVHPHGGVEATSPSSSKRIKQDRPSKGQTTTTVFAFDSGSSAGQGNLYVYYPPDEGNKTGAKQGVVPVSGGERGALLGVGVVSPAGGREVVVALCEKELVVLTGVL